MGQVNLGDYKDIYLQTAKEYLNKMSVSLGQLSDGVSDTDALTNLHIASHSLKSQSQVMGFMNVANICLSIENVSNNLLKEITQLDNETISNIKKEIEKLDGMLKQVQHDTDTGEKL